MNPICILLQRHCGLTSLPGISCPHGQRDAFYRYAHGQQTGPIFAGQLQAVRLQGLAPVFRFLEKSPYGPSQRHSEIPALNHSGIEIGGERSWMAPS